MISVQELRDWVQGGFDVGDVKNVCHDSADHIEALRNALAWAIDRLAIDDPIPAHNPLTVEQLKIALSGRPCIATAYVPPRWTESANDYHGGKSDAVA